MEVYMSQLRIMSGDTALFDLSPYLEEGLYTVRRVNVYDDFSYTDEGGHTIRPIAGYKYEIDVSLTDVPEEVIASVNAAMTEFAFSIEFDFPPSGSVTALFTRPDISVTAVRRLSDGVYWDEKLTLLSEEFYSDYCL
jgi:hypothetical protein